MYEAKCERTIIVFTNAPPTISFIQYLRLNFQSIVEFVSQFSNKNRDIQDYRACTKIHELVSSNHQFKILNRQAIECPKKEL
jgi:hypothetical protein